MVCQNTHTHMHTLLLACAHHFTIMWTDLRPWGQMIVLNSITVRVQSALHTHCSCTVTQCWCSRNINAPTLPPPPPLQAMFYMLSLIWPPALSDYVIVWMAWVVWVDKCKLDTGGRKPTAGRETKGMMVAFRLKTALCFKDSARNSTMCACNIYSRLDFSTLESLFHRSKNCLCFDICKLTGEISAMLQSTQFWECDVGLQRSKTCAMICVFAAVLPEPCLVAKWQPPGLRDEANMEVPRTQFF